ncbi:MAG: hypothetical protein R2764_09805 [Bacteroidales bacterium]
MKKMTMSIFAMIFFLLVILPGQTDAQTDKPYESGTVWNLTFVKLHANMGDEYLKGLNKTWKASMDEMVKQKLIVSYKILSGQAANEDDFDLLLMVEMENLASLDPNPERDKKMDEVEKKVVDAMGDEFKKTVSSYSTMRDIQGSKMMREIYLK